jgi:5'-nucleotidase
MSKDRPLILVSNDDGYQAPGLEALVAALIEVGDVFVVAPENPRSGVSRMITLHKPLRVREFESPARAYFCSGTPTDCVYIALNHLLPHRPDIVVSGINYGANLGDDVTYSGTAAAAFEAVSHGIPAIASSLVVRGGADWEGVSRLTRDVTEMVLDNGIPDRTILNINAPPNYGRHDDVEITRLGRRGYERVVDEREDPRGSPYYWIGGPELELDDEPGTDCHAIKKGHASITPVQLNLSHSEYIASLKEWNWSERTS